jgi:hypothetical protein
VSGGLTAAKWLDGVASRGAATALGAGLYLAVLVTVRTATHQSRPPLSSRSIVADAVW